MKTFPPQQFVNSCGLACVSYILGKSEYDLLYENPDILSVNKLNFLGLYCYEIVEILRRYKKSYVWSEYREELSSYLYRDGTIVYIRQIDHYLIRLPLGWGDSYRNRKGIPEFGYWYELPYIPSYSIYSQDEI